MCSGSHLVLLIKTICLGLLIRSYEYADINTVTLPLNNLCTY
uniref:Uncharacterized protein n=1 Tax=Arundo donax TaxID=35708 RepID=A0A0A9ALF7_ARUDO